MMPAAVKAKDEEANVIMEEGGSLGEGGGTKARGGSVVCEECCEQDYKYRCPGCGFRTCGVECVKSHKQRTNCDGKRKRTEFVNINDYNDNWLISDYNLLEETLRQADAAKRLREPLCPSGRNELTPALRILQRQAKDRSITLLYVATGMTKRTTNTSSFDKRSKRILWRVEWVFEGTDVRLVDNRVDENLNLDTVLAKHLAHDAENVSVRHRLRNFRWQPLHGLLLLLPKEPCSAAKKEYFELSLGDSLKNQLAEKSIIEFPTIHVLLPGRLAEFTVAKEIVKISKALPPKVVGPPLEDICLPQEPEGVPFKEEEIAEEFEEGEFLEDGEIVP